MEFMMEDAKKRPHHERITQKDNSYLTEDSISKAKKQIEYGLGKIDDLENRVFGELMFSQEIEKILNKIISDKD